MSEPLLQLTAPLEHAHARFTRVLDPVTLDPDGRPAVLDEAVATFFAAPHSYTGEDLLEISTHGAPVILEHVVRTALAHGARLARPGEFTERAFLSGRLDLTQAEAVHDLVQSSTLHQARTAARQLGGSLARAVAPAKQQLIALMAALEAGIDFAEDDIDLLPDEAVLSRIAAITKPLTALEATSRYGRIVREGFSLAIVGRPNAGKSSLFNALLARDRAIVTSRPGTTRDLITEPLDLDGIPVQLTDTAGLRTTTDEIESLGIARSHEALAEAALILLVIDSTESPHPEDRALVQRNAGRPLLVALTKVDLLPKGAGLGADPGAELLWQDAAAAPPGILGQQVRLLPTSAHTGAGLPELRKAMRDALASEPEGGSAAALLTNLRQHEAVVHALGSLAAAQDAVAHRIPHEMLLLDLQAALAALDELTGRTTADDILNLIFASFCIGK